MAIEPRPVCGKCHSIGVNLEYDIFGQKVIHCVMCGNIYPGGREGFYMSDRPVDQIGKGSEGIMEDKQDDAKQVKLCSTCHEKPTISDSSNICPSCMAKKANEKMRLAKMPGNEVKPKKTKEDKRHVEKTAPRPSQAVNIDFNKYPHVLKQVADLAENEIRPLDMQIIYLLKQHFDTIKDTLKAV